MIWLVLTAVSWALMVWSWRITKQAFDAFDSLVKTHEALAKSHDELCETMELMLEMDRKC